MPIFIDRHDLQKTTQAEVAEAHQRDLALQDAFGVRFLTYWFDEARGLAFCLVEAPDRDAAQRAHAEAHGLVAAEIIPVSLAAIEAFLGRIADPHGTAPTGARVEPAHRAIMFTDIVGSVRMTRQLGDTMAVELVRTHDGIVRRHLAATCGREVKHTGDGIMAAFPSTRDAVGCAKYIQAEFRRFNATSEQALHVRIGIASGEPVMDSCDLFGSTVQLASRLCQAALPDTVLVTSEVCGECEGLHAFERAGLKRLKGFRELMPTYRCA
ncbi:DUF4242 domain-containing protein [Alsobacter soli]|uniref:DUF4242 domain-containing protein n=1 Tax=Alsobacter soli TaxID=2109933 RepID=A0A2T1HNW5_9HYPH|nr:nickel-binding protein [Alsobacter soli]PSC03301.1 DUF4242 domain-containing protein [Alsobacter soli]